MSTFAPRNVLIVAVAAMGVFAMSSRQVLSPVVGLAFASLALACVAAVRWPSSAVAIGWVLVAIIPIYWASDVPGTHVALVPAAIVAIALLPSGVVHRGELRFGILDRLVVAYVLLRIAGYVLHAQQSIGPVIDTVLGIALPYTAMRLLGAREDMPRAAAIGVAIGGLVSSVIALREVAGTTNPYFAQRTSGHEHAFFARADVRLGRVRPEAAFGHAIALGMFLVFAVVLTLVIAWGTRSLVRRVAAYGTAVVLLTALVQSLVRGPLLMLAVAVPVVLLGEARRGRWGPVLAVAGGLAVLANLGARGPVAEGRGAW
jgi:hypothetical protein